MSEATIVPVGASAEIHYVTRGRGPVCLVLTSIGTKPYERQMPAALDEHLTLVFVDVRGSGRSTGAASDLTFDVLADDLEAVRAALGVARVAVLGHSIVGMLAVEYARRRPETVSHVIMVGTPPSGDMTVLQASTAAYFEQHASDERKRILRENIAGAVAGRAAGAGDVRADAAALLRPALRRAAAVRGRRAPARDVDASARRRWPPPGT